MIGIPVKDYNSQTTMCLRSASSGSLRVPSICGTRGSVCARSYAWC